MASRYPIRNILIISLVVVALLVAIPVGFLSWEFYSDPAPVNTTRTGFTNDASGLSEEKATVIRPAEKVEEAIAEIATLIAGAKAEGKKISIAGAQHSMGGHTIYPGGIVLDMKTIRHMQLDTVSNILTVGAGAMWSDIIPYIDQNGRSIAVMQSNNSFSVGGSISVNCHGWQPESPPISSTVESFRLIDAAGNILHCSRKENAELFSLVLGGYGLFGVIVEVRLRVIPNRLYTIDQHVIASNDYVKSFNKFVRNNPKVGMAYGRINVNPDNFMEEAILSTFEADETTAPPRLGDAKFASLRRTVFRSSAGNNFGKNLRWQSEKLMSNVVSGKQISRNQLLNEGVEVFQNTDTAFTDILHEYFIPESKVQAFIDSARLILPSFETDLLNITVRNVRTDHDTYLRYAREDVFAFVLLFNQRKNTKGEADMQALTRKLIDVAVSLGGTYYLPYRLHATRDQFNAAYPQAKEFFLLKKKYDPDEVFQNKFYLTYHQ